ncbi:MAG: thiamine pyrophosphate-binding protein [Chloroflexota bacterium]
MSQSNAEVIARTLASAGIKHVFGQPGGEVVELIEAFAQSGIEFVLMGHESAAVLAAGTIGLATGIPGVCLTTLGPGACNLTLGIGEAYLERHPLLALSARTPDEADWTNHQRLPLNQMFAPITKASLKLSLVGSDLQLQSALNLARSAPYGPVFVTLSGSDAGKAHINKASPHLEAEPNLPEQDDTQLVKLIHELNQSKKPLVVVGMALDQLHDQAAIRQFLQETGIPYMESPKAKGLVDPDGAKYLGTFVSASGDKVLNQVLDNTDFVLGIGYDPVETTYRWHLKDNYFSLAGWSTAFGSFEAQNEVVGHIPELLIKVAQQYDGQVAWQANELQQLKTAVKAAITPVVDRSASGLAPLKVGQILRETLPADTQMVVDTGQHKMLMSQVWTTNEALSFFCSNGLSSMGVGLPGAIALALQDRTKPIAAVMGDGCFNSMVQELETVSRLGIAPLLVIFCDQALSLIKIPQQMRAYPSRGVMMTAVDWEMVAQGYGVEGLWIRDFEGLETAVNDWVQNRRALVLAVQIDDELYEGNSY